MELGYYIVDYYGDKIVMELVEKGVGPIKKNYWFGTIKGVLVVADLSEIFEVIKKVELC